jgi:hypothetical protein
MAPQKPKEKMKIFGEQKNRTLDKFKPYQRSGLSDSGHGARRLQPRRPAASLALHLTP